MPPQHHYRVTVDGEVMHRSVSACRAEAFNEARAEMIRLAERHETVVMEHLTEAGWQRRAVWSVKLPEDAA